jgi:hypothetical protein
MYLGTVNVSAKFLPDLDLKYGRQAAILENKLRAIDPKLCTYVPLGKSNSQTKFMITRSVQSVSWLGHQACQVAKAKNQKLISLLN